MHIHIQQTYPIALCRQRKCQIRGYGTFAYTTLSGKHQQLMSDAFHSAVYILLFLISLFFGRT
jgi:hypothetical protein